MRGPHRGDAREVMGGEALGAEALEDALDEGVREVEVADRAGHAAGAVKTDRQGRRGVAPVPEALVAGAGAAQRVEGGLPGVGQGGESEGVEAVGGIGAGRGGERVGGAGHGEADVEHVAEEGGVEVHHLA